MMSRLMYRGIGAVAALFALMGGAFAQQPQPWQMTFQPAGTDVMAAISAFEQWTLWIITAIVLLVMALLLIVIVRYNHRTNPVPSRTAHNTLIEVLWTVVPVLILVAIAIPSFRLLYFETTIPEAALTVKATGNQWYWSYEYPDESMEGISFSAYMLRDDERQTLMQEHSLTEAEVPRLLAVDYPLVVPVGEVVRLQVTSGDVNHSFAMPSFGIKQDAIPGRLNETWFQAERPGSYFGQCSELCGREHAFMPIEIRVLEKDQFDQWVAAAKEDIDTANGLLLTWQQQERGQPVAQLVTQ